MTESNAALEADQDVSADAGDVQDKETVQKDAGSDKDGAEKAKSEAGDKDAGADTKAADDADSGEKSAIPDNWRELASNGDEDTLKLLKRYGSMSGVVKALKEAQNTIRSGKLKRDMPDASDEKAMAEWRKEQGIPDDPSGYKLPDTVIKRMSDADKPLIASFTDYAHKAGASQNVVDIASQWYFDMAEQAATKQAEEDAAALDEAETALRKDWAPGEYKANMKLASRFIESIPGVGESWSEARLPNGRRLGDLPEFIQWASDQGRSQFGDVAFSSPDSESKHMARKEELEKIRDMDFDRYEREGLDKELLKITEKELLRAKR